MSVKLRLQRKGRTKAPFYHIVAADSRSPRDGKFIEKIGTYNPLTVPATIDLDRVRAFYWVDNGAQPTDTVNAILRFKGVLYQKHLMRGVRKGAMTLEQAEALLAKWVENKEGNVEARKIETIRKKEAHIKLVDGKPKARPVKVVEVEETLVEEVVETSVAVESIAPVVETVAVVETPVVETVVETVQVVETPVVVETVAVVETPVVETVEVVETPVIVEAAAPVVVETVTVTETVVESEPIVVAEKIIEAAAPTATVVSTPAAVTTSTTTTSTVKTGVTLGSSTIVTTSKIVDVDDNQFATKTEVVGSTIVDVDDNQFKSETDFLRSTTVDVDDSEYASKTEVVATTTTVLEIIPEDDTTKEA
jgi:small subunit ribosomal protein S16